MITHPYKKPPGWGERIAFSGYKPQYLTAVLFTLKQLRKGSLEQLLLADLDAGRVDDLLLFSKSGELVAFQMKNESGELSYADFVSQAGDSGLLVDLVDGWQQLKQKYPKCQIKVHFLTSQLPSTSTHGNIYLPKGDPAPINPSFADFLEKVWFPYKEALAQNISFLVPVEWEPAFNCWQQASGLATNQFQEFAKALELIFGFSFPTIEAMDVWASRRDSTGLYFHFQSRVAEAKESHEPIKISEDDLKNLLGRNRFEERNVHYFKIPDWYCPITSSIKELESALDKVESGYIALLGSPGSGKSSLLTRTLVESPRKDRIVRYYAYIPDERAYGAPPRGEAVNFFQDTTQQIEKFGFQTGERLPELDLDLLRERFGQQLRRLAEDYRISGHKTFFLVDGLDHVSREQRDRVDRTFLAELPPPSQTHPGVVFVLGSQHLQGLPEAVIAQLEENGRVINIQPLGLEQTSEVLESSGIWGAIQSETVSAHRDETGTILQEIYGRTQGHPLALVYLVNQLMDAAKTGTSLLQVIETAIPFDGDIHEQYRTHWRQIEKEHRTGLSDALGLVARLRGAIDFQWLRQTWPERQAIRLLESRFRHFFRRDSQGYWRFFHNSFKQFLLARSIKTIDGLDPTEETRFHLILGERCQAATNRPLVHWETIFHFWKARRYEEVCDVATREFFEQQLFALRPLDEIVNDARLAVVAAAHLHDAVRMFRALFILSEYKQRSFALENHDILLLEILIDLEQVDKALHWLLDGQKLRVRDSLSSIEGVQKEALNLSIKIAQAGFVDEARELFSLAEPLHILRRGGPIPIGSRRDNLDVVQAWVEASPLFREVSDVVFQIQSLQWKPSEWSPELSEQQAIHFWRNDLLRRLGESLIALGRWDDALQVARTFDLQQHPEDRWQWFWLFRNLWWTAYEQGQQDVARRMIEKACSVESLHNNSMLW